MWSGKLLKMKCFKTEDGVETCFKGGKYFGNDWGWWPLRAVATFSHAAVLTYCMTDGWHMLSASSIVSETGTWWRRHGARLTVVSKLGGKPHCYLLEAATISQYNAQLPTQLPRHVRLFFVLSLIIRWTSAVFCIRCIPNKRGVKRQNMIHK